MKRRHPITHAPPGLDPIILEASFKPALPADGFADIADHLRATIGSPIADAAPAVAERSVPPPTRRPLR